METCTHNQSTTTYVASTLLIQTKHWVHVALDVEETLKWSEHGHLAWLVYTGNSKLRTDHQSGRYQSTNLYRKRCNRECKPMGLCSELPGTNAMGNCRITVMHTQYGGLEGPAGVVITGNPTDGYFVTGAPKGRRIYVQNSRLLRQHRKCSCI